MADRDVLALVMAGHDVPVLAPRPAWHTDAACRNDEPERWTRPQPSTAHLERLAATCATCPVIAECRLEADALPPEDVSFRAGEDHRERRARRRAADAA